MLDGNYYCSLKESSIRATFHLCDTQLISVVLWTYKYCIYIHILITIPLTSCPCKLYLSQVLCGMSVFWIMFPRGERLDIKYLLTNQYVATGVLKKRSYLRHLIQFHVSLFCCEHWWKFLFTRVVKAVSYSAVDINNMLSSVGFVFYCLNIVLSVSIRKCSVLIRASKSNNAKAYISKGMS